MIKSFQIIIIFLSILISSNSFAAQKSKIETRTEKILKHLKCMTCDGQSVLGSESEFAKSLKVYVSDQVIAGRADEEINQNLLQIYGSEIFFKPPINKQTFLLWIIPFFLIFIGFIAVVISLKKNNQENAIS